MPAPTPKSDQQRLLRERAYEARLASSNYNATRQKLAEAPEKAAIARKALAEAPVSNTLATSGAKRHEKWRKANLELHRERSRNSMRKLREKST